VLAERRLGYLTGAMLKADGVWTFKKWLYRGPEES